VLEKVLFLVLLTFVPVFELRWSIPIGLFSSSIEVPFLGVIQGFGLPLPLVFFVCVLANALLGFFAYLFFDKIIFVFLKVPFLNGFYKKIVLRAQKSVAPLVEKYGFFGMALFVAVPLPGSGTWTGALAANLLGFGYKKFFLANLLGVIIAGIIVTVFFTGAFSFFGV
jgi:uncharacterized membrane protein